MSDVTTGPDWDPAEFGETWAAVYDEAFAHLADDADEAVGWVTARLAGTGGRVLELGVGTGRIAIPLARAGLSVVGVDSSPRMLEALAAKPGGAAVTGVVGDMADPPADPSLDEPFDLVLIAFNTFFSLPSQDAQVRCLSRAADLLAPAGEVVVDVAVPQPWRFTGEATARDARDDQVTLEVADHDPVTQRVRATRVLVSDTAGIRVLPINMRYAWPAEIDLMARLAGLVRASRVAGWDGAPVDGDATRHITSYRRPDPAPTTAEEPHAP